MTKDRLDSLIEKKQEEEDGDTISFLESLKANLEKWGRLTEKQMAAFERIEYLASDEGKKYVEDWRKEYVENLMPSALICARYYLANPPYFNDIANKIIANPSFVPTEKQYRALCENKYATKVLAEARREPKYENGDIVQIREAQAMPYHLYPIKGKPSVVISNKTGIVTTHAQGAKVYKILPFGQSQMFECQERYLKGFRDPQRSSPGAKEEDNEQ
tara:strand:- start:9113 stop:9763 length:651 start_codon:yes stop_codon:yes gene_type:complete